MKTNAKNEYTGLVFSIQSYCIHDGPGIRTNVFMKGCPLECLWCQNPESQRMREQVMYRADLCSRCLSCMQACVNGAITIENGMIKTDTGICTGCGACAEACKNEARALVGQRMTVDEVASRVCGDKIFYEKSGGGVTLTGGEPLAQPEFSAALIKRLKTEGIHTAVETCGYATWEHAKAVLGSADLILFDIKHMESIAHKNATGRGNEQILQNLSRISQELHKDIIIRVPVIPGYNDTVENFENIASFICSNVPTCLEVELIPYHEMGAGKHEQIGREYHCKSRVPTEEELAARKSILNTKGIHTR